MTSHRWAATRTSVDVFHIHPLGDLIEHQLDDAGDCVCGPACFVDTGTDVGDVDRWIHHALDGRDVSE